MNNQFAKPAHANSDWTIDQGWSDYTPAEHAVWDVLYDRLMQVLPDRAAPEFLNGLEALEAIQEQDFDLILMDIQMPEMDGYEATERIRENPDYQDLPIIAMTANAMSSDREQCLKSGMNDHLPKPFEPEDVADTIIKWTQNKQH